MKPPQLAGCHRSGSRSRAGLPGLLKGAEAPGPGGCARGAGRSPPLHREAEGRGVPSPALRLQISPVPHPMLVVGPASRVPSRQEISPPRDLGGRGFPIAAREGEAPKGFTRFPALRLYCHRLRGGGRPLPGPSPQRAPS